MLELSGGLPKNHYIVMERRGLMILDGKRINHVKESYERNIINCKK